jgi:phosphoribosylformimino-5-aminoimidazole carboxamide ribotide isomerase
VIIIPAIDIKGGHCVRLEQGQMHKETVYSESPGEMAAKWVEKGAERLHLVDLDGAIQGRPINRKVIENTIQHVPIPTQLGGGIRDMETIEAYLDIGIHQVILGTVAYKNPDFVELACKTFPDRIILGIDARDNQVAVEGWTEETGLSALEMARRFESLGVSGIIYTDIYRDGMRTGPNIKATAELAKAVKIPVIASGGISSMDDIAEILTLAEYGVTGMITGRALYEKTLDLEEAIRLTKRKEGDL